MHTRNKSKKKRKKKKQHIENARRKENWTPSLSLSYDSVNVWLVGWLLYYCICISIYPMEKRRSNTCYYCRIIQASCIHRALTHNITSFILGRKKLLTMEKKNCIIVIVYIIHVREYKTKCVYSFLHE